MEGMYGARWLTACETFVLYQQGNIELKIKASMSEVGLSKKDIKPDAFEDNEKNRLSFTGRTSFPRGLNALTRTTSCC